MVISVVNHSNGQVTDEALQRAIGAINRQITEHFAPYWSMSAMLRLEGRSAEEPDKVQPPDLRGDAIIYLWNETDVEDAIGYHFQNARGIPYGFVFTEIAQSIGEPWSVTLSHEALELLADPETNLLVMGPHPTDNRDVFYWYEMCDAVQDETYEIDGIAVSNFVLPLYFTGTRDVDEIGARNDYLGRMHGGQTLRSFGINPGGYVGFYDPQAGDHDTFSIKGDAVAVMRLAVKSQAKETRRSVRYRQFDERQKLRHMVARMPARRTGKARGPVLASMAGQTSALKVAPPANLASASRRGARRRRSGQRTRPK